MDAPLDAHAQPNRAFTYTALPSQASHIRLIRLLPQEHRDEPICCQLLEYELGSAADTQAHLYEALSYVWGDPTEKTPITVNGLTHLITVNLFQALTALRNPIFERTLWVDAICIDQDNLEERANQVQLMARIYASSDSVIVWLGKEQDESTGTLRSIAYVADSTKDVKTWQCPSCEAWSKMGEICPRCGSKDLLNVSLRGIVKGNLTRLFQRAWFKRVWVLQEVAAARRVLIMCGKHRIDGHAFSTGFERLVRRIPWAVGEIADGQHRPVLSLIQGAIYRQHKFSTRSGITRLQIGSLAELVNMFRSSEASDPRDKIFALLGMQNDGPEYEQLHPDYTIPWTQLFERLTRVFLGKEIDFVTAENSLRAIINGYGSVLSTVSSARQNDESTQQLFECQFKSPKDPTLLWYIRWTTTSPAQSVRAGDILFLVSGAMFPCLVRPHDDFFKLVMILDQSPRVWSGESSEEQRLTEWDWRLLSHRSQALLREILLVWDWAPAADSISTTMRLVEVLSFPPRQFSNLEAIADNISRRLENAATIKEQCEFHDHRLEDSFTYRNINATSNMREAYLLHFNRCSFTGDIKDLCAIYDPQSLDLPYRYGREGWRKVVNALNQDFVGSIQGKMNAKSSFEESLLQHCDYNTPGIIRYIRNNAGQCIVQVAQRVESMPTSPALAIVFALVGGSVSFTDEIWDAVVHDNAAAEILDIIIRYWKRGHEINLTYEFLKKVITESNINVQILELLADRFRGQLATILSNTDLGKIAAVVSATSNLRSLDFPWAQLQRTGESSSSVMADSPLADLGPYADVVTAYRGAHALDVDSITRLLADGIDLNLRNGNKDTILLQASRACREDVVEILLEGGKGRLDLDCRDTQGGTPLDYGVILLCPGICKLLLEYGATSGVIENNLWWNITCLHEIDW